MDKFFTQTTCDRCHGSLKGGRVMSMFNEECICMECKKREKERPDYKQAVEADITAIKNENYNFKGVGM